MILHAGFLLQSVVEPPDWILWLELDHFPNFRKVKVDEKNFIQPPATPLKKTHLEPETGPQKRGDSFWEPTFFRSHVIDLLKMVGKHIPKTMVFTVIYFTMVESNT